MDFQNILYAGLSLGGLGLLFGAGLAYASQKFAVEIDPRALAVRDALPAANCGGCGYPGCDSFANAVVAGQAPINGCPVGGPDCTAKLAAIMGLEASDEDKQVAFVLCKGGHKEARLRYDYTGITDCRAAHMLSGGDKACQFGCLGYGTCERLCPFDAIHMTENGVALVDEDKCTACGICIEACPKDVIAYVPYQQEVVVECQNKERGGHVKKDCSVACIACGICQKACPFDAIHVENNVAMIDYDKCTSCMVCVEKCPTKAIKGDLSKRKTAVILEDKCIGCTICAKKCPVEAITGELKQLHHVEASKCIGCGVCEEKCPKDAIEMR